MGITSDDGVKQKLLDSLAEEPPMVISTAYAYAKNYVRYGEDITKAWTTAVQQASILDYVREKARAEAYESFKKEYENRLKADLVAILDEFDLRLYEQYEDTDLIKVKYVRQAIQQKISELKEDHNNDGKT